MTKVQQNLELNKDTILKAINDYCEKKELSKNELATQIGISSATLSHIQNSKWENISDAIWRKVWHIVGDGVETKLFNTNDNVAIKTLCDTARKKKLMSGLIADTGMGKTTSLKAHSKKRNTYYIAFDKTMRSKQFFSSILREMGIAFEGSLYDMVSRISDELNTQSEPLLIIDEAGKITHNIMLYLHVLRDKTIRNCGIVLAGMPYFKHNLIKSSNKQKEGCAEFYRRINLWHELEGLSRSEIQYICNEYSITDEPTIKELRYKKRFGDLTNAILLLQIQNI